MSNVDDIDFSALEEGEPKEPLPEETSQAVATEQSDASGVSIPNSDDYDYSQDDEELNEREKIAYGAPKPERDVPQDMVLDADNDALFLSSIGAYDKDVYRGKRLYSETEVDFQPYRLDQISETMSGYEPERLARQQDLKEKATQVISDGQKALEKYKEKGPREAIQNRMADAQAIIDDDRIDLWENVSIFDESPDAMYELSTNEQFLRDFVPYVAERFGKEEALTKSETLEEFVGRGLHLWRTDLNRSREAVGLADHLINDASGEQKGRFKRLMQYIESDEVTTIFERGRGEAIRGIANYVWLTVSDPMTWVTGGVGAVAGVAAKRAAAKYVLPKTLDFIAKRATVPSSIAVGAGDEAYLDYATQLSQIEANVYPTIDPETGEEVPQEYDVGRTAIMAGASAVTEGALTGAMIAKGLQRGIQNVPGAGRTNKRLSNVIDAANEAEALRKNKKTEDQLVKSQAEEVTTDVMGGEQEALRRVRGRMQGKLNEDVDTLDVQVKIQTARQMDDFTKQLIKTYNDDPDLPNIGDIIDLEVKASDVVYQVTKKLHESPADFDVLALERALAGADLTPEQFITTIGRDLGADIVEGRRLSVADAARQMQSLAPLARLINQMKNIDPAIDKKINDIFGTNPKDIEFPTRVYQFFKRSNDEMRGLMTSMPATFMRNMMSGGIIITAGTAFNLLESSLYHMGKGITAARQGNASVRGTQSGLANIVRDTFMPMALLFDPKLARQMADLSLKGNPSLNKVISRNLQETGGRDLSKYTRYSNALNLGGDVLIRRVLLGANIDKELRRGGTSFEELVESGKAVPLKTLERSVEVALKGTMAYMPKKGISASETVAHHFVNVMDATIVGGWILPFAKFMANAMAMQLRYSPASFVNLGSTAVYRTVQKARGKGTGPLTSAQLTAMRKQAAEGVVGSAAITAAVYYRANNQDTKWSMMGDTDIRNIWPIGFYMLLGDAVVKMDQGTISDLQARDFLEGLMGYGGRAGQTGHALFSNFIGVLEDTNIQLFGKGEFTATLEGETLGERFGKAMGDFFMRPLTQARIVTDTQRAFDTEAAIIKDSRQYEGQGWAERGLSAFSETMQANLPEIGLFDEPQPPRFSPTREQPSRRVGTLFKQLLGITKQEPQRDYEKELFSIGMEDYIIYRNTGEGEYDNEMRKEIGAYVPILLAPVMRSDRYLQRDRAQRVATVKNYVNRVIKPIAKAKAQATIFGKYKDMKKIGRLQWRGLSSNERALANRVNKEKYGETVEQMENYQEGVAIGNSEADSYW